jgi:DNA-binding transcriptional LysR family regulator
MDLDARLLRYFVTVAEEGHVTRAAERLGIQQPPLSQQIRVLEERVGATLLRRKARGVELTDAGRAMLQHARDALAGIDRAVDAARRAARGEEGRIAIGMAPTAPFHPLVPQAIRAFRQVYPSVAVSLEEALTDELVDRLAAGHIDVAVVRNRLCGP